MVTTCNMLLLLVLFLFTGSPSPEIYTLSLHDALPIFFWYRSTLAHNAPRVDGGTRESGDAVCETFDAPGEWAWMRGRYGVVTRTLVTGPAYVLDVVELASREEQVCELPWHFQGRTAVAAP